MKGETSKTYPKRVANGLASKYLTGSGLDIGGSYDPLPGVESVNQGLELSVPEASLDFIYSSHMLEHVHEPWKHITEWHSKIKVGGYLFMVLPHAFLYERSLVKPSRWNEGHHHMVTPALLLSWIERALVPNTYRIRHFRDFDEDYQYDSDSMKHPQGCYEMEVVVERIAPPTWKVRT